MPEELAKLVPSTKLPQEQKALLDLLARAGGQDFLLVDVQGGDIKLAGAIPSIPDDFMPAVVLDASGRVRSTYRLWREHRATLRLLPAAASNYAALAVRLWIVPSGQRSLESPSKRREVVEAIADKINNDSPAEWLIVHYKGNEAIFTDLAKLVEAAPGRKVHPLTWGQHHGRNDFADVPNVVIVGQLTYDRAAYPALVAAATGKPTKETGEDAWHEVRIGEFQHHLLQAVCRGSVRRSRDGKAGYCRAFVIASPFAGIEERVKETFPGCRLYDWKPTPKPLSGHVGRAADYLLLRFANVDVSYVKKKEVIAALGISGPAFSQSVLRHPDFQEFLGREHIIVDYKGFEKYRAIFEPHPGGGFTMDQLGTEET